MDAKETVHEALRVAYLAGLATGAASLRMYGAHDAADVLEDEAVRAGLTPERLAAARAAGWLRDGVQTR